MATADLHSRTFPTAPAVLMIGLATLVAASLAGATASGVGWPSTYVLAVLAAVVAAWTDHRCGKIRNALTYPIVLLGVGSGVAAWAASRAGLSLPLLGPAESLQGLGAGFAIVLVAHLTGGGGMGDVKLAAALGSLLGPAMVLSTLGYTYAIVAAYLLLRWLAAFGAIRLAIVCIQGVASRAYTPIVRPTLTPAEAELLRAPVRLGPFVLAGLVASLGFRLI